MLTEKVTGATLRSHGCGAQRCRKTFTKIRLLSWAVLLAVLTALPVSRALAVDGMMDHDMAVLHILDTYDVDIKYDYIATLMRIPNAFGEGAGCVVCHNSNDPLKSPRGLDLSTCEGIHRGSAEAPARAIFLPGKSQGSILLARLRDNRMPLGVSFDVPTRSHLIDTIKDWINAGAKNNAVFQQEILPAFADPKAFGGDTKCTDCHLSNQEPPSFHELDLTSYEGVMLGADSVAKAAEGLPPVPIVIPGDAEASPLWGRLAYNRMPAGIDPSESRNHPNMQLLSRWIDNGAPCD